MQISTELLNGTQVSRATWEEVLYPSLENLFDIEVPFTIIASFNFQPGEKPTSVKEGFDDSVEVFDIQIPELSGAAAELAINLLDKRRYEIGSEILDAINNARAAA